jgi:hypothetical protein
VLAAKRDSLDSGTQGDGLERDGPGRVAHVEHVDPAGVADPRLTVAQDDESAGRDGRSGSRIGRARAWGERGDEQDERQLSAERS